jgi:hypothetical protein
VNTCKTCSHWIANPQTKQWWRVEEVCRPIDPDTYQPMQRDFAVRICMLPSQTFCEAVTERNGFGLADGSGYMALFATAEDFGCVRHESRTEE